MVSQGMSRAAACLQSPVCTTSNRRSGGGGAGLTHPAGWTQPVRARPSSPVGCPQTPLLSSAPSEGSHTARDFSNAFGFVFFWLFPSPLQSDSGDLQRTQEAWLCFRGLIWVIKFSTINATGVPLLEIIPSKLNQKIYGAIKS